MAGEGKGVRQRPYRVEVVRGEPYQVGGRTLVPETRFVSYGRARATIGSSSIGGWAAGLVLVTPLAMVEQMAEGEQRVAITDATATTMRLLLGAGIAMALVFATLRQWLRWRRQESAGR